VIRQPKRTLTLSTRILAGVLALAFVACAPQPSRVTVDNRVELSIHIAPAPDKLPFDPRNERLLAANRQLSELVGHGVQFDIDAALVAEWNSDFQQQLIEAVEGLLRLLTDLRRSDPAEFARSTPALRRIDCSYSVLVEYAKATFSGDTLRLELPAHPRSLIDYEGVRLAIDAHDVEGLDQKFARAQPETVSLSESSDYFHWLSNNGYGYRWEKRHPRAPQSPSEKVANDREGEVVSLIVRLYSRMGSRDSALAAEVRKWLFSRLESLNRLYGTEADHLPPVGSNTPMRRGERELCGWLERELPRASDVERLAVLNPLFPRTEAIVCPNIDRFALGLREADAWLKAGKPGEGGKGAPAELMDGIVCPSQRNSSRKPERGSGCYPSWLLYVLADEPSRKRLAFALDARDPALTEQLFASLVYGDKQNAVSLTRLLNPQKPAFAAALAAFAENWGTELPKGSIEMLAEFWRERPERRGDLLYVFARTQSDSFWEPFKAKYGAIGQPAFAQFIDHGSPAFEYILRLWPALDRNVSLGPAIASRLTMLLPDASQPSAGPALRTLVSVVSRLCDEQAKVDLAALHSAFEARFASRPNERAAWAVLLRDTASGGCSARKKAPITDEP